MDKNLLSSGGARGACEIELDGVQAPEPRRRIQLHLLDGVEILRHQRGAARWRGDGQDFVLGAGSATLCFLESGWGKAQSSSIVKKNVNPQWMQTFRFPCDDGLNVTLQCGNQPVCRVLIESTSAQGIAAWTNAP